VPDTAEPGEGTEADEAVGRPARPQGHEGRGKPACPPKPLWLPQEAKAGKLSIHEWILLINGSAYPLNAFQPPIRRTWHNQDLRTHHVDGPSNYGLTRLVIYAILPIRRVPISANPFH
jgi:hypothetical protein